MDQCRDSQHARIADRNVPNTVSEEIQNNPRNPITLDQDLRRPRQLFRGTVEHPAAQEHSCTHARTSLSLLSVRSMNGRFWGRLFGRPRDRKLPAAPHRHKSDCKAEYRAGYNGHGGRGIQHPSNYNYSRANQGRDCVKLVHNTVGISLTSTSRTMPPPIPVSIPSSVAATGPA